MVLLTWGPARGRRVLVGLFLVDRHSCSWEGLSGLITFLGSHRVSVKMGSQVFYIGTVKSSFLLRGLSKAQVKDSDTPKMKAELNVPIVNAGKRVPVS